MMSDGLQSLQTYLDYQFNDISLLELALTHRSVHHHNNERLEFMGDAVLGAVIARALFDQFPDIKEGKLTRMRARLVRGDTLSQMAAEMHIQPVLILGEGELKAGGRNRSSIRADALEAIFGAICLDSDYKSVEKVILNLYSERLAKANPNTQKDPKTLLQEAMQKRGKGLPEYRIITKTGQDHDLDFEVECRLLDLSMVEIAKGKSRRVAEQTAAQKLLSSLGQ